MPTLIAISNHAPTVLHLWRNGRRKNDGYRAYYVVKFRIERDGEAYRLTPEAPCTGPALDYVDMAALKTYWEYWANAEAAHINYEQAYP